MARYQRPGLTVRQRLYLRQPPLLTLKNALWRVIDEPVDANRLLAMLEAYETEGRPSDADALLKLPVSTMRAKARMAASWSILPR